MKNFYMSNFFSIIPFILLVDVRAILPRGIIQDSFLLNDPLYCAPAEFSPDLSSSYDASSKAIVMPKGNIDGCRVSRNYDSFESYYWLVERGNCTFEEKAIKAYHSGAEGVIISNSLKGIYKGNFFADPVDYECSYGQGYVKHVTNPVWGDTMNANMPTSCTEDSKCHSGVCVLTNKTTSEGTRVCCAFDLYMSMGRSSKDISLAPPIPAVYIRMKDRKKLQAMIEENEETEYLLFARPEPFMDLASILIWLLATTIVVIASLKAAYDDNISNSTNPYVDRTNISTSAHSSNTRGATEPDGTSQQEDQQVFEVSLANAVVWALCSSAMLILLFYIDLHKFMAIAYVVASTGAMFAVLFRPIFASVVTFVRNVWCPQFFYMSETVNASAVIASLLMSFSFVYCAWRQSPFIWMPQDIMGGCVCVVAISAIRLPNFKVATVLLSMMFFYDIFFVFVTPYLFGTSIMVKVATGGPRPDHHDENFCEKYPTHTDCQAPLVPMLLRIPSIMDYSSGGSMLGLGDIVLPGLLLAFAARLDWRVLGPLECSGQSLRNWMGGCYFVTVIGYAFGLFGANVAVAYFQVGQPALLYIVPATIGPVSLWAYSRGCFKELWDGPAALLYSSAVTMVADGEDQRLLDALPTARKVRFGHLVSATSVQTRNAGEVPVLDPKRQLYQEMGGGVDDDYAPI